MISKEQRQEIVRDFALRHGGVYDPAVFVAEVAEQGEDHPAYGWFEWDKDKAAGEYNIWQARVFANGLRIKFSIEEIKRSGTITVREVEMPFVLSPMDGRQTGGGYYLTNPNNPDHMAEHCLQASLSLNGWMDRYQAALLHAGIGMAAIEKIANALEAASGQTQAA